MLNGRYTADGKSYGDGFSISHREAKGWSLPETVLVDDITTITNTIIFVFQLIAKP